MKNTVMHFRALSFNLSLFLSIIHAAIASTITWKAKNNNMMRVVKDNIHIFVSFCKGSTFFVIAQAFIAIYIKYCRYETHKLGCAPLSPQIKIRGGQKAMYDVRC